VDMTEIQVGTMTKETFASRGRSILLNIQVLDNVV
jgi:hypothetical protein